MLQLTAIVHPAAQATSQAAAPADGVTNVAVVLAAGLMVVVLLRLVRVVTLVITALTTMVAALGGIALLSVALVALFAVTMAAHLLAR
jgi:hypothetical protein